MKYEFILIKRELRERMEMLVSIPNGEVMFPAEIRGPYQKYQSNSTMEIVHFYMQIGMSKFR